ncbi:MAG: nucleotidyltransferase family protein [Armatimonadota bacterium]|nr:nucleotidyltransferase family protein [Armatimonadota bacterium]
MDAFLQVFAALGAARVRYLVIGGVATALHGIPRMTADIDLAISLDEENARRAMEALLALGFLPRAPVNALDFADSAKRETWVAEKSLIAFSLYRNDPVPIEVDVLAEAQFDFEDAWTDKLVKEISEVTVNILDKRRLIEMKERSARPNDLEDASALRRSEDDR